MIARGLLLETFWQPVSRYHFQYPHCYYRQVKLLGQQRGTVPCLVLLSTHNTRAVEVRKSSKNGIYVIDLICGPCCSLR